MKTRDIALGALCIALIVLATAFIKIPTGIAGGYIHVGDSMIFLSIMLMPSLLGVFVGGIGSALADFVAGYASFAPLTFVAKSLMGLAFYLIIRRSRKNFKLRLLAFIVASVIMIASYFVGEVIMFDSFEGPLYEIPFNAVQAVGSIIVFEVVYNVLNRTNIFSRITGE